MKTTLFLAALLACLLPSTIRAQATRTWVSGVGDDANPGSRTAPCKTFAGVLSKTAAGGVINILDPGGFGGVTITKSITIEGNISEASILTANSSYGVQIVAGPNDIVILRNLTLEGLGTTSNGIKIVSAGSVHIEDCHINGFYGSGINLLTASTNMQLFIKNTTIHNCTTAGITLAPSAPASALLDGANVTDCGDGIVVFGNARTVITDSTTSGNAGTGFLVGANAKVLLTRGTASGNHIGIQSEGLALVSDSTVAYNDAKGLKTLSAGKIRSYGNNRITGNGPDDATVLQVLPR